MTDEQTIYLSPEEELTSIRERLESTPARRITLVIPHQTQFRSLVGWRLIYRRMRELDKELLVISPDQQVRALARDAGFKTESQAPTSSRPRLSSRAGNVNTRGAGRERIGGSRAGGPTGRVPQSQSPAQRKPRTSGPSKRPQLHPSAALDQSQGNIIEEPIPGPPSRQERDQESSQPIAPATFFDAPAEERFSAPPPFPLAISTTPSVRPRLPQRPEDDEDELPSNYDDDYDTAQNIRKAAREGNAGQVSSRPADTPEEKESQGTATSKWEHDPYAFMDDDDQLLAPLPFPEQRGSAPSSIEDLRPGKPDISDRSTTIMASDIEDLGDEGPVNLPEVMAEGEDDRTAAKRLREQGGRPRPRSGQIQPLPPSRHSPRSPRPGPYDIEEEEPPVLPTGRPAPGGSNRPPYSSRNLPRQGQHPSQQIGPAPAQPRYSQPIGPAQPRYSQPIAPAQQRYAQSIPTAQPAPGARPAAPGSSQRPPSRQLAPSSGARSQPRSIPPRRQRQSRRTLTTLVSVIALLLLTALALFYFVPVATVTIDLQAKAFSQQIQLNATADPQSTLPNKVLAQTLTHDFSASGEGAASGTTSVGNAKAQGSVNLVNHGTTGLIIPSNMIIQTPGGIQFVTDAEAVVPANNENSPLPLNVTAVQPGDSGNVSANTITVIPPDSLKSIATLTQISQNQVTASTITATNPNATSGGGASNEPAVTAQDLAALKLTLHQKLQQTIQTWLNTQTQNGDIFGKTTPDVLGSANPLPDEQLSGAPAVNQPVTSGKFSASMIVHIQVLVARAAVVQAAARAQLDAAAGKLRAPSTVARQLPVTLTNVKSTSSANGNALAITATANGEIIPLLDVNAIRNSIAGQGINQAENTLKASMTQAGVQNVKITISPSFLSILPLWSNKIQVNLQPITGNAPKK